MSACVHGVVAGPTLKKSTPAETSGAIASGSGPFASTIGNVGTPSTRIAPLASNLVVAACAVAAASAAPTHAKRKTMLRPTTLASGYRRREIALFCYQ